MTSQTFRLRLQRVNQLKLKVNARIPVSLAATSPILLDKSGGVWTFSFDLDAVTDVIGLSYQPLDSDLTAIAALSTTSYGRSLLTLASATALAAEVDSFFLTPAEGNAAYQPLDSDLTAIAALTTTSYGRAFLALADAAAARTAIGAGTISTQNANNVTITGGSISGITDLAIADGGTGASTAAAARTNLGSTTVGDAVFVAVDAAAARTALALGTAATQNTGTSGANVPLLNGANTWSTTQTYTLAPAFTDQSGSRTALGLGTAATQNTGTSGATIPFLNGTNTWANAQTFTAAPVFTNQSGSRTALGLGTAAVENTGTSGATVPLLNGANVHSGAVEFSTSVKFTNTSTPTFANGVGSAYVSSAGGLILRGQGSVDDLRFLGASGGTAFTLPNGTSNISFPNAIQVATINNLANTVNLLIRSGTTTSVGNNVVAITDAGVVTVTGALTVTGKFKLASFVVASLPAGSAAGESVYASNCRVYNGAGTQEGAGVGTGGAVEYNGSAWKISGTNVTAVA